MRSLQEQLLESPGRATGHTGAHVPEAAAAALPQGPLGDGEQPSDAWSPPRGPGPRRWTSPPRRATTPKRSSTSPASASSRSPARATSVRDNLSRLRTDVGKIADDLSQYVQARVQRIERDSLSPPRPLGRGTDVDVASSHAGGEADASPGAAVARGSSLEAVREALGAQLVRSNTHDAVRTALGDQYLRSNTADHVTRALGVALRQSRRSDADMEGDLAPAQRAGGREVDAEGPASAGVSAQRDFAGDPVLQRMQVA